MSKSDMQIFVVKKNSLFENDFFEGFRHHKEIDYESRILANLESMRRGSVKEDENHPLGNAERNSDYKQPIAYTLIINPEEKKVFAYQRSSKGGEERLFDKWSWGVGGHIEACDVVNGNPIKESRIREIKEEVYFHGDILGKPEVLGYVYHDFGVNKVHFGILYLIKTNNEVTPNNHEMSQGRLIHLNELEKIVSNKNLNVEDWSRTAFEPLKDYFSE